MTSRSCISPTSTAATSPHGVPSGSRDRAADQIVEQHVVLVELERRRARPRPACPAGLGIVARDDAFERDEPAARACARACDDRRGCPPTQIVCDAAERLGVGIVRDDHDLALDAVGARDAADLDARVRSALAS